MSRVSRKPLRKDIHDRMMEIFQVAIAQLKDRREVDEFLHDFLSPVEKIMLAKRLSIAILLGKGYSYEAISEVLHVTPSTIAQVNMNFKYSGKGYKRTVERLLSDESQASFFGKIEDSLMSLPPARGTNIAYISEAYESRQRRRRKAF